MSTNVAFRQVVASEPRLEFCALPVCHIRLINTKRKSHNLRHEGGDF